MKNVVHAYTMSEVLPKRDLNSKLCGARGGSPYCTGHIKDMTCGNCLRIIRRSTKLCRAYSP
jgi:hypothetical protein